MATETEEPRTDDVDQEEGGPVKSFLEHLEDLRWMLIKSASALAVAMLICLIAGDTVVAILKRPLEHARIRYPGTNQVVTVRLGTNRLGVFPLSPAQQSEYSFGTNRFPVVELYPTIIGTNQYLGWRLNTNAPGDAVQKLKVELINLAPAGGFLVALQIAFYGGLVISGPVIFFFVLQFVFPALKITEKKYLGRGLFFGVILFACGVSFCYFVLMPVALSASVLYSNWLGFSANQWRAEEYITFVCKFMLGMGIGFQLPVVILVLVKIGILNYRILSKARRYMIVINLILGALLTTPEVMTQVMMAFPLQLLYEISVWITWWWERKERKRQQALEAAERS